ncbi:Uncharacterized protein R55227_BLOPHJLP_01684 [Fructobacillus tropaeoli]|uniref:polymorphic toxin type 50 domain-containing protein n=1 Tax=Fructobacillus tropaeoli TaxID=709323 RepID=UPI002DA9E822|nr:Uncharacterized protein R55227_BLOPHJLP_01684 [Fructobacillus tropaeoli]
MADKQNKSYWVQRELDHADDIKKASGDQLKVINKLYNQALDDITDDINRNFIRYAKGQGMTMDEAMKLADKTDVTRFVDKVKQYVADKDFSDKASADLKLYNLKIRVSRLKLLQLEMALEIDRLNGRITNSTEDYFMHQTIDEYKRQSTILGQSVAYTTASASQLVNTAYSLAGEGSYTFSANIWKNTEQLKNKLSETLNKVILQGKNPNQFNKEFRDVFSVQPSQSGRLLITETARVQGDVQRDSYKQSGIDMYDIVYERRACQTCISIARSGPYKLSKAEVGTNMYPFHPNCMCSIMPATENTKDEKIHVINSSGKLIERLRKIDYKNSDTGTQDTINKLLSGEWTSKINNEKQAPHIESTRQKGKSYFADDVDVQKLFDKYAGTGVRDTTISGKLKNTEIVKASGIAGSVVSGSKKFDIEGIKIHYSKARLHVVPWRKNYE